MRARRPADSPLVTGVHRLCRDPTLGFERAVFPEIPMTLTRIAIVTVLGMSIVSLASTQSSPDRALVETQIASTLHQMYEAEKRRDLKFVLSHLAEDFAEVAGDGKIYHRDDIEANWSEVRLNNYQLSDCVFRLMTSDAAYLSCNMQVDATYKGQPFPRQFRVTTVWTHQGGEWLIRFEQGTVIPDHPSRQ